MKRAVPRSETNKQLSPAETEHLLNTLKSRFEKNIQRHKSLSWAEVEAKLQSSPFNLWILSQMEATGGEPDVVYRDKKSGEFIFFDCSPESPRGRRSVCYDREAQVSRKTFPPEHNAIDLATAIGIELLTEEEYLQLQKLGDFDTTTSSWIKTPPEIRKPGGALFGDRRYGRVFIYQNSAHTYYRVRGFRGSLRI